MLAQLADLDGKFLAVLLVAIIPLGAVVAIGGWAIFAAIRSHKRRR